MDYRRYLAGIVAVAACARAFATPVEGHTVAAPDAAFACVREQLGALDYKTNSIDTDEQRVTGTKVDLTTRRSDTQFRRMLDRIEIDVGAGADGRTEIKVLPRTFAEYTTQRGPTEVEERSSERVRGDADRLLAKCQA